MIIIFLLKFFQSILEYVLSAIISIFEIKFIFICMR